MAFLDNSGDIILDAVLTDAGRQRLSRGNFKIVKFAFGDEEVNYNIFNGSHPSGSAFYDLEIMQTPILEAFTNNTSLMKSKLITMTRNNILYMPIFKINNLVDHGKPASTNNASNNLHFDDFILLADTNTEKAGLNRQNQLPLQTGILRGAGTTTSQDQTRQIAFDQGIDSSEGGLSFRQPIPLDLVETAYLIKMDHRIIQLGSVNTSFSSVGTVVNQFVDDDGIATYYVAQGDGTQMVTGAPRNSRSGFADGRQRASIPNDNPVTNESASDFKEMFPGPLGGVLRFALRSSTHIRNSTALFDEFGTTVTSGQDLQITTENGISAIAAYKYIDTLVNIVGVTTGYSIDVPIRVVKKS